MAYKKGMPRYRKNDDGKYQMDKAGTYYKGGKNMYEMTKAELEGMDSSGKQPGDQPHINPHPDDKPDYPGYDNPKGGAKKSEVSVDDFQKSLDQLEAIASADDVDSRKDDLLQKAMEGEELGEEDRDYLFKALGGDEVVDTNPEIVDDIVKSFSDNDGIQKALDVSEYLEAQHDALIESLTSIGDTIEKSDQRQHNYNLVLAKAIHQSGQLIKAMSHRLGVLETQPARQPKSRGVEAHGQHLEKGFVGAEPPSEQLSKSAILDTLEVMMQKSVDSGRNGLSDGGNDLLGATAKYEQVNQISKSMLAEVMKFRQENAQ